MRWSPEIYVKTTTIISTSGDLIQLTTFPYAIHQCIYICLPCILTLCFIASLYRKIINHTTPFTLVKPTRCISHRSICGVVNPVSRHVARLKIPYAAIERTYPVSRLTTIVRSQFNHLQRCLNYGTMHMI